MKHGLADTLLEALVKNLDQFDKAIERSAEARRAHVSASAELDVIGAEIVHLVKVMDALNRPRFVGAAEVLASGEAPATSLARRGPPRPADDESETPPETGAEMPAA